MGYICSRTPRYRGQEHQNGACKNFTTRVKNRSQARFHRRQTSSDSSRLVRIVGEGGAKRDSGQNGIGVARRPSGGTRPGAHHLVAHQEVLFILFFRRIHTDFKNYQWITYCNVCCSQRIQITPYFRSQITRQRGARNSGFIHSSFDAIY